MYCNGSMYATVCNPVWQEWQECNPTCSAPLHPHQVCDPNVEQSQLKWLRNVLLQQIHERGAQQADLGWVVQLGIQQGIGHRAGRRGAAPARAPVAPLECEGTGMPPSLLYHYSFCHEWATPHEGEGRGHPGGGGGGSFTVLLPKWVPPFNAPASVLPE